MAVLLLHGHVDRHGAHPPGPRQARARAGRKRVDRDRVGRRLPPRRGVRVKVALAVAVVAAAVLAGLAWVAYDFHAAWLTFRSVWQYSFYTDTSTVTVHIRRVRAKLERAPGGSGLIETVWGVGYRLAAESA